MLDRPQKRERHKNRITVLPVNASMGGDNGAPVDPEKLEMLGYDDQPTIPAPPGAPQGGRYWKPGPY